MTSRLRELFVQMTGRAPDRRDVELLDQLSVHLPPALREDIGMQCEIIVRTNHIRQLEVILERAGNIASKKAEMDGEAWASKAADKVWRKVRDQLSTDPFDATSRVLKFVVLAVAVNTICFGGAGWVLGARSVANDLATTHARSDIEFVRCVDAAAGAFATSYRRGQREAPVSMDTVRNDLMICGAEYADRRAAGA